MKTLPFVFFSILLAVSAFARDKAGNGGGAHVCRDPATGAIRSIEFYDLYEARARYGYASLALDGKRAPEMFESAMARLDAVAPSLGVRARSMRTLFESKLLPHNGKLLPTVDADRILVDAGCGYEQVVVWDDRTGKVFIDDDLYEKLDVRSKAALYAHEAIYKIARIYSEQSDSDETRLLVGRLFSDGLVKTEIDGKFMRRFQALGATLYSERREPLIVDFDYADGNRELSMRVNWSRPECYAYASVDRNEAGAEDDFPFPTPISALAVDQTVSLTFDRYGLKVFKDRERWDARLARDSDDLVLDGGFSVANSISIPTDYRLSYLKPSTFKGQKLTISSRTKTDLDPNIEVTVEVAVTNPICGETLTLPMRISPNTRTTLTILQ